MSKRHPNRKRSRHLRLQRLEQRQLLAADFGDAPSPFPVTLAEDGARHEVGTLRLGTAVVDTEADGTHSAAADFDDLGGTTPQDEDGVSFGSVRAGQLDATVAVVVSGAAGKLDAWVDFNGDGNWGGVGEQIFVGRDVVVGTNQLSFDVPASAKPGSTIARFRLSTAGGLKVSGAALDGEVEDHQVTIESPARGGGYVMRHSVFESATGQRRYADLKAADIDGDGDMDLATISSDGQLAWFENNGSEVFTTRTLSSSSDGSKVIITDIDTDGDQDILEFQGEIFQSHPVRAWINDGTQSFSPQTIVAAANYSNVDPTLADIDGDGDLDIVGLGSSQGTGWYENVGNLSFVARTIAPGVLRTGQISAADIDGDGDMDMVAVGLIESPFTERSAWYENDGNQNFTEHIFAFAPARVQSIPVDLDHDGDIDIVSDRVWYENNGSGSFTSRPLDTGSGAELFVADIDGDGDLDVGAFATRTVKWLQNDGNQNFTSRTIENTGLEISNEGLVVADIDGDGDLDFAAQGSNQPPYYGQGHRVSWYEMEAEPEPASLVVNTTADDVNDMDYVTSLREAIAFANTNPGADTITFDASLSGGTISLGGTELEIEATTTIDAGSLTAGITIDAQQNSRVLHYSSTSGDLTLIGLNVTGGRVHEQNGGGILFASFDTFTLQDSTVHGNSTTGDNARGGGIHAGSGALNLRVNLINSTLSDNHTAGAAAFGGGIFTDGGLTVTNSTVSGNSTTGATGVGGGIFSGSQTTTFNNSIILGNVTAASGVANDELLAAATVFAGNNIVGANTAAFDASVSANVSNADPSIVFDQTKDNQGVTAGLLANNGGAVQTIALLRDTTNPAIDAGQDDLLDAGIVTDARGNGFPRRVDIPGLANNGANHIDLGSYEVQPETPSLIVTTAADGVSPFDDQTSLREALLFANSQAGADTITFDPNIFTGGMASLIRLNGTELTISDEVTIDGSTGTDVLITADANDDDETVELSFTIGNIGIGMPTEITDVSASFGGTPGAVDDLLDDNSRLFNITSPTAVTTIKGITLTGGRTTGNNAPGGGILSAADLMIVDSNISGNSTLTGNSGGGAIASNGKLRVLQSTVSQNVSGGNGGGIEAASGTTLVVMDSALYGNRNASATGGAIFAFPSTNVSVTNSTLAANHAGGGGAIGAVTGSTLAVTNSTLTGNVASIGSSIFGDGTSLSLANSILLGNVATTGDEIFFTPAPGSQTVTGPTIIGTQRVAPSGPTTVLGSTVANVAALVFAEPIDYANYNGDGDKQPDEPSLGGPITGRLKNNGGTVLTVGLRLDETNPALDAGQNDRLTEGVSGIDYNGDGDLDDTISNDSRGSGFFRLVDSLNVANNGSNAVDLGAFENQFIDFPATLDSFTRQNPLSQVTGADTLQFHATFNETVQNVDVNDFVLSGASTAGVTGVAPVQGTGESVYLVTVGGGNLASFNGTVGIDLSPSQNITDLAGNPVALGEPPIDETYTVDNVAPYVESVTINDGSNSRSQITSVSVVFDKEVDHTALQTAFSITNIDTATAVSTIAVASSDSGGKTTAVLTFSGTSTVDRVGTGVLGDSLADGNYRLNIASSQVIVSDSNATMAADYVFGGQVSGDLNNDNFFRLYGDADGDGRTNINDFVQQLLPTYDKIEGDSGSRANLDFDGNGRVNINDFVLGFLPSFEKLRQ